MKKDFALSIFAILNLMFLALFYLGCSLSTLEQNPKNALDPPQKPEPTPAKTEESTFTVIEIEDLEYPTLVASIRLPFRVNPKNTVVLAAKHAYVTTEKHLHVIDVSVPQFPSYLTTLAFPDEIGKVLASGNRLVVAGHQKFHIIDISVPSQPVIQSTTHLPNQNGIKDMDVRDAHLYVLGEDNYSLYIFSLEFRQPRFVKSNKLAKRWWLLSPGVAPPDVKQFKFPPASSSYSTLHEPLLSQRGFLQLHPGTHGIIRSSNEFLVSNDTTTKANDLPIKPEMLRKHVGGLVIIDSYYIDEIEGAISIGAAAVYSFREKYRGKLFEKGKKTFNRQKPKISYAIVDGKMQQIAPNPLVETVEINNKTYEGQITDYQISGNLLYIVNEKGFFSIFHFFSGKDVDKGKREKVVSTTPLQASKPISIAIGKHHTYVLAMPPIKEK